MTNLTLKVIDIRNETHDTKTFSFKQPGLKKIKYYAGQYLTIILRINGRKYARAYSFSSSPSVDSNLEITVKRMHGGVVSNFIYEKLRIGDILEVSKPMGSFTVDNSINVDKFYLWGAGSGITPLYSIIKELLYHVPETNIQLVYGNQNLESAIFTKQLNLLVKKHLTNFKMINFFSRDNTLEENDFVKKGRITKSYLNALLEQDKLLENCVHYICGPNGLVNSIQDFLLDNGINQSKIFSEKFDLYIDPKELTGVEECVVNILFNGNESSIVIPKGKSVLDGALDNGIELPYSCQTGICDTCKGKLIEGNLKMIGLSKTRDDLSKNEFLLCCSFPTTNKVAIQLN